MVRYAVPSAMRMAICFLALFIVSVSYVVFTETSSPNDDNDSPKLRKDGADGGYGLASMVVKQSSATNHSASLLPNSGRQMSCQPRNPSKATTRTPLVIFAMGRTGSNLMFNLIRKISQHDNNQKDTDLLPLYEHFANNGAEPIIHAFYGARAILENCKLGGSVDDSSMKDDFSWENEAIRQNPSGAMDFLQSHAEKLPPLFQWIHLHRNRQAHPSTIMQFLSHIPSKASKPVFAMKVFDGHLENTEDFIADLVKPQISPKKPKIAILWRRRFIESYVSLQIAHQNNVWKNADTKSKVVTIERKALERYLRRKRNYYISVRNQLDALGVPYQVFEYGRDLLSDEGKLQTIQRLQTVLDVTERLEDAQDILSQISIPKQSGTPLEVQVSNWDEVVEWGYGGELEEWEDLFATSTS